MCVCSYGGGVPCQGRKSVGKSQLKVSAHFQMEENDEDSFLEARASSAKSVNWPRLSPLSGCFSSSSSFVACRKTIAAPKPHWIFHHLSLPMKKGPDRSSMTEAGGSKGKAVLTRHFPFL